MKTPSRNLTEYLALTVTTIAGSLSLLLFGLFLFGYSFTIIEFGYGTIGIHAWNAALCLIFFIQHSIMIRRGFRKLLAEIIPDNYQGALFTIASGIALMVLVLLWQNSGQTLISLEGYARWLAHGMFFASLAGIIWGMHALHSFDMLGIQPILHNLRATHTRTTPFTIRGPYRWVRHPLYFYILILLWCYPDVTVDRLLLNTLFTAWIVLGARLEENDLVIEYGDSYINYQSKVPMLVPWKLHRPFPSNLE